MTCFTVGTFFSRFVYTMKRKVWAPQDPAGGIQSHGQSVRFIILNSRFMQQELPACRPVLTPKRAILTFFLIGAIFVPIGVALLLASRNVVEIVDHYDLECIPPDARNSTVEYIRSDRDKTCHRFLTVPKDMKQPIFVYYQLHKFYQNHKRYVKSWNNNQLRNPRKWNETDSCGPQDTVNGIPIVPCGLIAWSLFNDTYALSRNNLELTINKTGISWKGDRERRFGANVYPKNFQHGKLKGGATLNESILLRDQEDLLVWMRIAPLPTFRKLYGKIEVDLKKGDIIHVTIQNRYNTYSFEGKKKLILSTTSWLGGKSTILAIGYIVVGGSCLVLAMAASIVQIIRPRQIGDPSYLSWNRNGGR